MACKSKSHQEGHATLPSAELSVLESPATGVRTASPRRQGVQPTTRAVPRRPSRAGGGDRLPPRPRAALRGREWSSGSSAQLGHAAEHAPHAGPVQLAQPAPGPGPPGVRGPPRQDLGPAGPREEVLADPAGEAGEVRVVHHHPAQGAAVPVDGQELRVRSPVVGVEEYQVHGHRLAERPQCAGTLLLSQAPGRQEASVGVGLPVHQQGRDAARPHRLARVPSHGPQLHGPFPARHAELQHAPGRPRTQPPRGPLEGLPRALEAEQQARPGAGGAPPRAGGACQTVGQQAAAAVALRQEEVHRRGDLRTPRQAPQGAAQLAAPGHGRSVPLRQQAPTARGAPPRLDELVAHLTTRRAASLVGTPQQGDPKGLQALLHRAGRLGLVVRMAAALLRVEVVEAGPAPAAAATRT
eukprot:CAMPEP_0175637046 /NCGR_PEP_ID=MMETSP0097-20121207/2516_1 /TAXON_ID=311494 /ORGANISM="Alexandrium monilatum, Strain CCMP3105" /LENGTH=410 /DNA_ID=CAMNT_0016942725 /DNA_START=14 /DNA_END=1242 /DNA_ORIENTATION=-